MIFSAVDCQRWNLKTSWKLVLYIREYLFRKSVQTFYFNHVVDLETFLTRDDITSRLIKYISVFFYLEPGRHIPTQLPEYFTGQFIPLNERVPQEIPTAKRSSHPSFSTETSTTSKNYWSAGKPGSNKGILNKSNLTPSGEEANSAAAQLQTPLAVSSDVDPSPAFCRFCGKKFSNLTKYKAHESYHKKGDRFPCRFCGKLSHNKFNMLRHERTHTGEKPFNCRVCGKSFKFKENLKSHEMTHTRERPYKCQTCGKPFTQASSCKRHEATCTYFEQSTD